MVDEAGEGQRLDNFLLRHLKGVPKSHVYRIVRSGEVRVNGRRAGVDDRLAVGDAVRVPPIRLAQPAATKPAPAREFPVLFEDDHLLIIDKPAGVAVHGGSGVSSGVIEQLRAARQPKFLELAHRIDRETSGILVLAKRRSALTAVQADLRNSGNAGGWKKEYRLAVFGQPPFERKEVKLSLTKDTGPNGERHVRVDEDGQYALTRFAVQQRYAHGALLSARIATGRTHQIRVHAQSLGLPLVGDERYGDFALNKARKVGRMLLHAARLELTHPASGERLVVECPLPADFQRELDKLDAP
ncbi:RluA family pseudouridine synthase [Piscinibacterium candidicorallinum]|uniref:Pseudouridine synthase n=1 Tax=Piscinibacterium candidicorallinum TaxID=1793872 RepID=A0ABV7H4X6_9BURK